MARDRYGRDRSRDRDYERDVYPQERDARTNLRSGHTNSNDPKSLMSRVFIGNLPHDKVTREEILEQFSKYGRVQAVNILKGFGFVQFDTEEQARKSVSMENGCLVKGSTLDVKMAVDGRKEKRPGGPPGRPPYDNHGGPPGRRSPFRDRSPIRDGRSNFRPPYDRTPPRDSYGDAYGGRPSLSSGRDSYEAYRKEPYSDHYREAHNRDPAYPPVSSRPPPPASSAPKKAPPVDCEVTVLSRSQREYADTIDQRLKTFGMLTFVNVLVSEDLLTKAQDDIAKRSIPFNIVVSTVNEQHRSITLRILHGTPQEHRNMPLEDALNLVNRNFRSYMESYRERMAGTAPTAAPPVTTAPASTTGNGTGGEDFIPPDHDTAYLLNLLADNRFLTLEELNKVIRYLNDRRDRLAVKQGVATKAPENSAIKDEAALAKQQQELQAKILSVLGNNDATMAPTNEPPSQSALQQLTASYGATAAASMDGTSNLLGTNPLLAGVGNPGSVATSVAAGLNLNNPGIQQALDTLISSSGSILQNLSQGISLPSQTAPVTSQAALYQNYAGFTGF